VHQRNVAVFADGEVDRSPCGSGTCARLAALADEGRLPAGSVLRHESIAGSTFTGRVLDDVDVDGRRAVIPQVTWMSYRTGEARVQHRLARSAGPRIRAAMRSR
jgi:proline racemase